MVDRNISYSLYIGAFIITLLIFGVGVWVGGILNQSHTERISENVNELSNDISSLQLIFLMKNSSSFCPVYLSQLKDNNKRVEELGHKLTYLEEEKDVKDLKLKRNYFVLEAKSYFLTKKVETLCNKNYNTLLYFYSNTECKKCKNHGENILKARDELNTDVQIFSFDGTINSSVAQSFMSQYNVTDYPTTIINGKKYEGYKTKEELKRIIG